MILYIMLAYRADHGHCRVSTDDAWSCYGSSHLTLN